MLRVDSPHLSGIPRARHRPRVLFVINDLGRGGAETMLLKLVSGMSDRFEVAVVSLTTRGEMAEEFERAGAAVFALVSGLTSLALAPLRLIARIRSWRPDVVSTWMYHSDLMGGLAARLAGVPAVAWNIRNSDLAVNSSSRITRAVVRFNARLSNQVPRVVLCCSMTAKRIHEELGFASDRFLLVPNGFDLGRFRPMPEMAASVRQELEIDPGAPLIGMVARWHPQKNHRGFIKAAALLRQRIGNAHFLLIGSGCEAGNTELEGMIRESGLDGHVRLLGQRLDTPRLNAALDVASLSSSSGEAFPNVLGEAMACAVPCVTTDVGDAAFIVGETGRVVPAGDSAALAAAWAELLEMPRENRRSLGEAARRRVQENFELGVIRNRYEDVFLGLAGGRTAH